MFIARLLFAVAVGFYLTATSKATIMAQEQTTKSQPKAAGVELKSVTYDEYAKEITSAKGKLVVVFFWANYSPPDKKMFAEVVKLHDTFARQAVVFISVSLDEDDKENRESILKFLTDRKATFKNLILNEEPRVWQEKIKIEVLPAFLLFGRDGKQVRRFDFGEHGYSIGDVQKVVEELVKKQ